MLLQMVCFILFNGWVIFQCRYVPHLLYPFLSAQCYVPAWERMDACIYMAEPLHCSLETPTTLLIGYMSMSATSLQLCLTLYSPIDCSSPGFSIHRILQARILEYIAKTPRGSSQPRDQTHILFCFLHWQTGSLHLVPPAKPLISYTLI